MNTPLAIVKNNKLAIAVMVICECVLLASFIFAPLKYPTMEMSLFKFILGYGFLVLLFFAGLHVLLVRTQTITIYSDYIQIKSVMARKIILWRDVQTVYFSEKEVEYSFLNSHSPALVLNLKDGTRYLIWCSQKRKAETVRKLAPRLNLNNGFVTLL